MNKYARKIFYIHNKFKFSDDCISLANLDDLGTGDLAPGGKKTGWILFQIPKGDEPIELRYKEITLFNTTDRGAFSVKLR